MVICPVDSTITEQRISHLSAYFHLETQLYSSDHAASSTVDVNVHPVFRRMVGHWLIALYVYIHLRIAINPLLASHEVA